MKVSFDKKIVSYICCNIVLVTVVRNDWRSTGNMPADEGLINSYLKFIGQGACTVKTIKLQSRQCLENILSRREYKGKPITSNGVYRMMQKIADMTGAPLQKLRRSPLRLCFFNGTLKKSYMPKQYVI